MAFSQGLRAYLVLSLSFFYLSAFLPRSARAQTAPWLRQTGSLHVTGVQSDPLSTLFIKWRSGVSEV